MLLRGGQRPGTSKRYIILESARSARPLPRHIPGTRLSNMFRHPAGQDVLFIITADILQNFTWTEIRLTFFRILHGLAFAEGGAH